MTPREKAKRLIRMLGVTASGAAVFMAVWIGGCYLADYVLHIPANSYRMAFGYFVGTVALFMCGVASRKVKKRLLGLG